MTRASRVAGWHATETVGGVLTYVDERPTAEMWLELRKRVGRHLDTEVVEREVRFSVLEVLQSLSSGHYVAVVVGQAGVEPGTWLARSHEWDKGAPRYERPATREWLIFSMVERIDDLVPTAAWEMMYVGFTRRPPNWRLVRQHACRVLRRVYELDRRAARLRRKAQ